jgi:hypothetical protein
MREAQQPYEFSVSRLAKRWDRDHEFIVGEIRAGRLEARRIGGRHLRVHLDEVVRYERAHGIVAGDASLV